METNKNFKGLDYYQLQQDDNGNIKLNDYNDVLNARRARVDILLNNPKPDNDINFIKLNEALSEKLMNNQELLSILEEEDKQIGQEELKVFSVLDNLDNLESIKDEDLLEVSILFSDLSFIERNIVLNTDQDSELAKLKDLFLEKKASGKEYTDEEYRDFVDYIDSVNDKIKLELEGRGHEWEDNHDDELQDEIAQAIDITDESNKK